MNSPPSPAPPELDPAQRAAATQQRIESMVSRLPIGRTAVSEMHRVAHLSRVRGSAVGPAAARLDKAVKAFNGLQPRITGSVRDVVREASQAEHALRDLAERIASVERVMKTGSASPNLAEAHADLLNRFTSGVSSYEALVSAAASYVAEEGRLGEPFAINRLIEAGDPARHRRGHVRPADQPAADAVLGTVTVRAGSAGTRT